MTKHRRSVKTTAPANSHPSEADQAGLDRRRFVGLVGASLAAQYLVDAPTVGWSATASAPSGISLIPGYLRGSHLAVRDPSVLHDLCDPRKEYHTTLRRVIPEELPLEFVASTDLGKVAMGFDTGLARVWVHGVMPPERFRLAGSVSALHLEAELVPKPGLGPYSSYVWGYDKGPVTNISGPISFDAPVEKRASLTLWTSFERTAVGGGIRSFNPSMIRFSTVLTLEDRYGEPRLRPGVYCMPLNEKAQRAFPLVANRDWLVPDELPYLLFSVQPVART